MLQHLIPAVKIELPFVAPLKELLQHEPETSLTCSCCGWKGSQLKARKHYLVVEAIAEIELFCPKCNQYLGFIAEPKE